MGVLSSRFQLGAVFGREGERSAVVDRRLAGGDLALAAAVEFQLGFVAGIEPARGLQSVGGGLMRGHALGLTGEEIVRDAEPAEVFDDGGFVFGLGAFGVGIVDAQQELAAVLLREEEVEQRRARIADMQQAGGRWGKADNGVSHGDVRSKKLSSPAERPKGARGRGPRSRRTVGLN